MAWEPTYYVRQVSSEAKEFDVIGSSPTTTSATQFADFDQYNISQTKREFVSDVRGPNGTVIPAKGKEIKRPRGRLIEWHLERKIFRYEALFQGTQRYKSKAVVNNIGREGQVCKGWW